MNRLDVLYLLLPISGVFAVIIVVALLWAVKSGQFEDLEGPAYKILMDDDEIQNTKRKGKGVKKPDNID